MRARVLSLPLLLAACGPTATDVFDTDVFDTDLLAVDTDPGTDDPLPDPGGSGWRASCRGTLLAGGNTLDPCPFADVDLTGLQTGGAAADVVLALGESPTCFAVLTIDDMCGPGTYYVGGGAEATVTTQGCGGFTGEALSGSFEATTFSTAEVDGAIRTNIAGELTLRAGTDVIAAEIFLAVEADAPAAPMDFSACSNVTVDETLEADASVGAVDVLFVVDDSASMQEEQNRLANGVPAMLTAIRAASADWHVGVITTDTDNPSRSGKLVRQGAHDWVDPTTPDPEGVFSSMARVGLSGSPDERGRRAVDLALTQPLLGVQNAGFYRDDASLSVIFLSDEDDASGGNPSVEEFTTFLEGLKTPPAQVFVSAIVGPVRGCRTATTGTDYLGLAATFGGDTVSICSADYSAAVEHLQAANGGTPALIPTQEPVVASLVVTRVSADTTATELVRGTDWRWDDDRITLLIEVVEGDTFQVAYAPLR